MKRLFILLITALFIQVAVSQTTKEVADWLSNSLAESLDGTVTRPTFFDSSCNCYLFVIKTPSYFDDDIVKIIFRNWVNKYSDVKIARHWWFQDNAIWLALDINKEFTVVVMWSYPAKLISCSVVRN